MSRNIKISIILPIYNVEKYLKRCVDSVLAQTLEDIEIILATDGPENCDKICEEYANSDTRVNIISHPGSYGKAVNKGIEIAQGEYIGIVETDDWLEPEMFETLYKNAIDNNADMAKCGWYDSYDGYPKQRITLFAPLMDIFNINQDLFLLNSQPSVWSAIYKKDFLDKNNIRFIEDRVSYIDSPFHIETLVCAKTIVAVHKPLYFYYQDNPNQSVRSKDKISDALVGEKYLYNRLSKNIYDKYLEGLIYATTAHLMWNYVRITDENKQKFWQQSREFIKSLDLQKLTYKYFSKEQKTFLLGLIKYDNYKRYEKTKHDFVSFSILGIPLLKIKQVKGEGAINSFVYNNYYYILGVFFVLRRKKFFKKFNYYLFGFLPLLKIKIYDYAYKCYLFGLIPIMKVERI